MECPGELRKIEITVARHEERISTLEEYQIKQNCCLQRVEDKLNALQMWLIGLMGGMIVSLVLLIINLIARGR
ncbi:MAG: hypothetical protein DDT20_00880 [Firmicutes bacterium]|nr:hypothetical protein [Bacillota bacterium]MBT9176560.1 hypothetical protein [Bacillota bacterium]